MDEDHRVEKTNETNFHQNTLHAGGVSLKIISHKASTVIVAVITKLLSSV